MTITENQAQVLCSPTEWKTVINSFPPKLSELEASGAKKNSNRIARFLSKAEKEGSQDRAQVMREALDRLQKLIPDRAGTDKQSARRQRKKKQKEANREQKKHRAQLRERFQESKAKKSGESVLNSEKKTKKKSIREQFLGERK